MVGRVGRWTRLVRRRGIWRAAELFALSEPSSPRRRRCALEFRTAEAAGTADAILTLIELQKPPLRRIP